MPDCKNGEKYFEVYSPFLEDGTTKDDWKFGISGKIAYQTYPDYKTANIAIGLYYIIFLYEIRGNFYVNFYEYERFWLW